MIFSPFDFIHPIISKSIDSNCALHIAMHNQFPQPCQLFQVGLGSIQLPE